ncbi:chemotaxis protein CheB [Desulfovibrio inopinatus]|uniref:chemotaxis protein CheB n=1 Tax=Desulfovibrio inopinatus TaxID=102109 RepID=UPI00041C0D7C|nr:chemotaxis protein CheB [Desulfovibrio inopinatus]
MPEKKPSSKSFKEDNTDSLQRSGNPLAIVGIGASAGGLAAFEAFFSGMPHDPAPEMALILVQHLAPDHKSLLAELIRRYTSMHVFEVENGMEVLPHCVYIIPPNCDMTFQDGKLQLIKPIARREQRLPIDFFFCSLAKELQERAIGVILSGSGNDGTQGVRAIKAQGGMVIAQTPASTEYDSMPRSAIATGLVDYELAPAEMPSYIIAYVAHTFGMSLQASAIPNSTIENISPQIHILLRAQTGHDFSQYKPSTINRRIKRRMAMHQIAMQDEYIQYLQQNSVEVEALFRDLLIGVTGFFRDPEAFTALEQQVIPKLFTGKTVGSIVRVWSPGCSTGEEAYSIAILLQEYLESVQQRFDVQIFATDIDSQAIAIARSGLYPSNIVKDVSPERLSRFFTAEPDGCAYRIHKSIRDMLVFSEQNVIKDPPFSKIDLISCRNLLIYLGAELQKQLIPLFHYALNPDGFLFLGTSETVGDFSDLFTTLDRTSKLYQRNDNSRSGQNTAAGRSVPLMTTNTTLPQSVRKEMHLSKQPSRELVEQTLLHQDDLSGVLVNAQGDILYLHGRTGQYLEPTPGETSVNNIIKMAREGLRRELSTALHKARSSRKTMRRSGLRVKTNGDFTFVNLKVCPVISDQNILLKTPLYLVILESMPLFDNDQMQQIHLSPQSNENLKICNKEPDATITALRQELKSKDEYLQTTIEELETSNEELKSSNEEMQSINEELQSSNEELETSKEELQSVNEELTTVNTELQNKLIDLAQANNDMSNLLAGTGIATLFVDHNLCILRFTPATTRIINLIQSDVGRPVGNIVSNMVGYNNLIGDVRTVLNTLLPKEVEVQIEEGKWYTMRILPYRNLDNVIEGAVITFVDITEMKKSHELLQKANEQLRLSIVARDSKDAIVVLDLNGNIITWNSSAQRFFGWSEKEALTMNVQDIIPPNTREQELENMRWVAKGEKPPSYETRRITKEGRVVEVWLTVGSLINEEGQVYAMSTTYRNSQERPGT